LPEQRGLDAGIGLDGPLQIGSGLIDCRANVGVECADLCRLSFASIVALTAPQSAWPGHDDSLGAEHRDTVFEAGDGRSGRDIARNPCHEHLPDALTVFALSTFKSSPDKIIRPSAKRLLPSISRCSDASGLNEVCADAVCSRLKPAKATVAAPIRFNLAENAK
jgi:hypothetical protein